MKRVGKQFLSWAFFFLFFLCNVFGHQRISNLYEGIVVSCGREKVEKFLVLGAGVGLGVKLLGTEGHREG